MNQLKLNTKRTIYIGFAFFTILMLWQVYNFYCPLFLEYLLDQTFGVSNYSYIVGVVMALDNILALFMLPLFGVISDKTSSCLGKRMPYIVTGTIISLLLFPLISVFYIKHSFWGVVILMGLILIAMNVYRAPAVALMPDVTPKPLRAKANAIINFIGYIGAIVGTLLTMVFNKKSAGGEIVANVTIWPFIIVSIFMIVALVVLVLKIRENKIVESMKEEMELGETLSETNEVVTNDKPLGKRDKVNLWLLIVSVFLWYFAFNAIETFGSTYANEILNTDKWGMVTTVLAISSLLTFLPCTKLVEKVGRKYSIMIGLILMIVALAVAIFMTNIWVLCGLFAVAGIGWALINVCSYPMFVELASSGKVGKFTGYYYSASQIAQSITPIAIGVVLSTIGYKAFFPYALLFMSLALIVFMFIKVKKNH